MQYRFSQIKDEDALLKAVDYVATRTAELAKKVVGKDFPNRGESKYDIRKN